MSTMTSNQRHNWIMNLFRDASRIEDTVRENVKGKKVKITSDYNGQAMGRSRPSLKGKIFEVEDLCFGHFVKEPHIKVKGQRLYLGLREVEFID